MPIAYDGQVYKDEYDLHAGRPIERADVEGKTHITVRPEVQATVDSAEISTPDSTMPLGSSEKPAGEFNSEEGTTLPAEINVSPEPSDSLGGPIISEPYGLNPPERETPFPRPTISGMVKGIYDSIKTWGDAIQGKTPTWAMDPETGEFHTSPQVIEKSLDLAGLAVMGPAPVAGRLADGTLGSFAGVRSATVNKSKLYKAQDMEFQGAHPDDIWKETGFFKAADGQWKYEIPNDMSNLKSTGTEIIPNKPVSSNPKGWGTAGGDGARVRIKNPKIPSIEEIQRMHPDEVSNMISGGQSLKNILHNPELFKAYPFLEDLKVAHMDFSDGTRGMYHPRDNTIYMSPAKADDFHSTLLHEVQHAIQEHEGFGRGGNSRQFSNPEFENMSAIFENKFESYLKSLQDKGLDASTLMSSIKLKKAGMLDNFSKDTRSAIEGHIETARKAGVLYKLDQYVDAMLKIDKAREVQYEKYKRLMGEVESRNVQTRIDFDNTERFLNSPRVTEDRPRFLQTDGAGSTSMSSEVRPPKDYYDKVPLEQRLSRSGTEPSHPGYRWEVYDPKTGKVMRKDIMSKSGATRTQDNLDNKYGGYKYRVRMIKAKDMTESEMKFLADNNINLE